MLKITTKRNGTKKISIHISKRMDPISVYPPYITNGHILFHSDTWESMGNTIDIAGSNENLKNKALGFLINKTPFAAEKTFGEVKVAEKQKPGWLEKFAYNRLKDIRELEGVWVEIAPPPDDMVMVIDTGSIKAQVVPMACRSVEPIDGSYRIKAFALRKDLYDIVMEYYYFIGKVGGRMNALFTKVPLDYFEGDQNLFNPIFAVMEVTEDDKSRELVLSICMPFRLDDRNMVKALTEYMRARAINWRWVAATKTELKVIEGGVK